jgi:hypothetical protein
LDSAVTGDLPGRTLLQMPTTGTLAVISAIYRDTTSIGRLVCLFFNFGINGLFDYMIEPVKKVFMFSFKSVKAYPYLWIATWLDKY